MSDFPKLTLAFRYFDRANALDPNKDTDNGQQVPKELLYARRMSAVLRDFEPNASEVLQLTARCQHICRWEIPRSSYEMNRSGYLRWRQALRSFHAEKAMAILKKVGYDQHMLDRVRFLLLKKQLHKDPESQCLQDVVCLVFLQYYFEDFRSKHSEAKMLPILKKTWEKMSAQGRAKALEITYTSEGLQLITRACLSDIPEKDHK